MKTKIILIALLSVILSKNNSAQQNLVLNPSFEDVNENELSCNYYNASSFDASMNNWETRLGTADIYNTILDVNCVMHPNNSSPASYGYQNPKTGNSYIGIAIGVNNTPIRESILGELSEPLEVGKTYLIRFFVSLADKRSYAINNLGIKFLTSDNTNNVSGLTADAYNSEIVSDKIGWTELEMQFTPETSGFTHFIIGNFFPFDENEVIQLDQNPWIQSSTYYYIDDVSIVESKDASLSDNQMSNLKLFPNPSSDIINITYANQISNIIIYDLTGRKVLENAINAPESAINVQRLSAGTYLLNIVTADGNGVLKFIKK